MGTKKIIQVEVGNTVKIYSIHEIKKMVKFDEEETGGAFSTVDCSQEHIMVVEGGEYCVEEVDEDGDVRLKGTFGTYPKEIIEYVIEKETRAYKISFNFTQYGATIVIAKSEEEARQFVEHSLAGESLEEIEFISNNRDYGVDLSEELPSCYRGHVDHVIK